MSIGQSACMMMIGIGIGRDDVRWWVAGVTFMFAYTIAAGVALGVWDAWRSR